MKLSPVLVTVLAATAAQAASAPGPSGFTAPSNFPTSAFSTFYVNPAPTVNPQPAIFDPVLNFTFPLNLTLQTTIPQNTSDPVVYPNATIPGLTTAQALDLFDQLKQSLAGIIVASDGTNCSKCLSALALGQIAARAAPTLLPQALVSACKQFNFASATTCEQNYESNTFGAIWVQILSLANVTGLDGRYICNLLGGFCPVPPTTPLNVTSLFPKPRPANVTVPKASGQRVKVMHMSDLHLDPRYAYGAEANCSQGMCCRTNRPNTSSPNQVLLPAPLYGSYKCDSPYWLIAATMEAIPYLTGTNGNGTNSSLAWSIYTGDLVSHDNQNELSRAYVEYTETAVFGMMKKFLSGPIFATLGNHDTNPDNQNAPHSLPGNLSKQMSWDYNHVAGLWEDYGWLNTTGADLARMHYGGYSVKNKYGLRIISLNTDFWYKNNYLNYINMTNPDMSGMLQYLINELQSAEDNHERVWIIGHVLSGWDGSNPLKNPTDLFYQIVARYAPHVIAGIFFGHTHEDEFMIYYANNGTVMNSSTALMSGWIGPSITPLTNLNSGFRMYEVDTGDFQIYNAYTWYSNVSTFSTLNTSSSGPSWAYEYSTRDTYLPSWPADAPLNATFWHNVTLAMEANHTLVSLQNTFQGKSSINTPNCTSTACVSARICYMRSGSGPIGSNCPQGFGSVQSKFTGVNF